MWILKQKKQAEKQRKLASWPKAKVSLEGKKREYTNPKGNTYTWFFRSGKLICDNTTAREDPDGYRAYRKPNSGEVEFVYKWQESWGYRRFLKNLRKYNKR